MALSIPSITDPTINGFRLTLESGVPVSATVQSAKTNIYFTPYKSGAIALYTSGLWTIRISGEVTKAVGTLVSATNYDMFAYWTGSAIDFEFIAWTNDTTRATAIVRQDGVFVKNGDVTRRYVGTFRTTATTTVEDSAFKRFLWNVDNQVNRLMVRYESAGNWAGSAVNGTWRQTNANTSNKIEFVIGQLTLVECLACGQIASSTSAGRNIGIVGIGLDSTTTTHTQFALEASVNGNIGDYGPGNTQAIYKDMVNIGYHVLNWNEWQQYGNGSGTGDNLLWNANSTSRVAGLAGSLMA